MTRGEKGVFGFAASLLIYACAFMLAVALLLMLAEGLRWSK